MPIWMSFVCRLVCLSSSAANKFVNPAVYMSFVDALLQIALLSGFDSGRYFILTQTVFLENATYLLIVYAEWEPGC